MSDLISRQDVIEALCRSSVYAWSIEQDQTAHNWALNIIKAIPSADANQNNGRLINADVLMDLLKARKQFFVDAYGGSFHCMSEKDKARCDEVDACIASIVNAPTVSADDVQGKWEDKEVFNETDDDHIVDEWQSARCSVCGKYHTTPFMYYFDDFNFCPNCGAKMDGERREP